MPLFNEGVLDSKMATVFLSSYGKDTFRLLRRELDELKFQEFYEKLFATEDLEAAERFQYNISVESREYRLAREYIDLFYEEMYVAVAEGVGEMFAFSFERLLFSSPYKQRYEELRERVKDICRGVYNPGLKEKYIELYHRFVFDDLGDEAKKAWNREVVLKVLKKIPNKPKFFEMRKNLEEKYEKFPA